MNSYIGRMYPTTKAWVVLLIIVVSMFTPNYMFQLGLFAVSIILSIISGTFSKFVSLFFKSIFVIVLFIFIVQTYIIKYPDSQTIWWFINFSQTGLNTSIDMTTRIIAISSIIILFFQVTSVKDITEAMDKTRISKKVSFVVSSTIQLVPQMSQLSKTITEAQMSRGIESQGSLMVRMKAFIPMIGPLVLSSIQQTEERVLTLESRGFSSKIRKTSIYELKKHGIDYVVTILCILIFIAYLVWRLR